jgi:hypothetical protein
MREEGKTKKREGERPIVTGMTKEREKRFS